MKAGITKKVCFIAFVICYSILEWLKNKKFQPTDLISADDPRARQPGGLAHPPHLLFEPLEGPGPRQPRDRPQILSENKMHVSSGSNSKGKGSFERRLGVDIIHALVQQFPIFSEGFKGGYESEHCKCIHALITYVCMFLSYTYVVSYRI